MSHNNILFVLYMYENTVQLVQKQEILGQYQFKNQGAE